jgi:hypothetical protein
MIFSLDRFVEKFVDDLDVDKIPKEIDIIIGGGAFNASYGMGVLLYIKKLEKLKKIKVNRISGTSAGAILGFAYIIDKLELINDLSNELMRQFKQTYNFFHMREMIMNFENYMNKNDYKLFNKKLYVTHYDNIKKKIIIKRKYNSNKDVLEQLVKTSFIPYLMNGDMSYNDNIDAGFPYIFKNSKKNKIMYINLLSHNHISEVISVKNETNGYMRLFSGVLDVNLFLTTQKSTVLCSYLDKWTTLDFIAYRITEYSWIVMLIILDLMNKITEKIPNEIKEYKYCVWIKHITRDLFMDIIGRVMN